MVDHKCLFDLVSQGGGGVGGAGSPLPQTVTKAKVKEMSERD